jgi:hypothetical protein
VGSRVGLQGLGNIDKKKWVKKCAKMSRYLQKMNRYLQKRALFSKN